MTIEEAGTDPAALARAVLDALGSTSDAIPVYAIAGALDIVAIEERALQGCEGMLVMPPDRECGTIAISQSARHTRQRFTIAHELGHFLNVSHVAPTDTGFVCTSDDFGQGWSSIATISDQHRRQEQEANRFAIELLAPPERFSRFRRLTPDLDHVEKIAAQCEVSREAIARRYVELSSRPIAIIFSQAGKFRYPVRHGTFPFIDLKVGAPVPSVASTASAERITDHEDADPADWNIRSESPFAMQTMWQQDGYAMTLLIQEDEA